ncbi:MAG: hypothetical protein HKM24_00190 [Gammaproteobacteria bacterium]|nr:hypothetical protein [Gammaproteobacteria bacterium]
MRGFKSVLSFMLVMVFAMGAAIAGGVVSTLGVNEVAISGTLIDVWVTAPGPEQRAVLFVSTVDSSGTESTIPIVCQGPDAIGFGCTSYVGPYGYIGLTVSAKGYLVYDPLVDGLSVRATTAPSLTKG